jgi:uncharacterized membrane protein
MPIWMLYALLACTLWGFTGLTQKLSTNHISAELSFFAYSVAFVPIAGVILWLTPLNWNMPAKGWILAILGGTLNGFGVLTSFAAYRSGGKASVVTPLVALFPVVTVVLAIPLLHEHVGLREVMGIVMAVAAAAALSYENPSRPSKNT